jgi:outer membrane receptor for ferrienterochelin and colicin
VKIESYNAAQQTAQVSSQIIPVWNNPITGQKQIPLPIPPINDCPVVFPHGGGFSLTTRANLPKNDSGGLEFTTSGRLVPKLTYSLSGNLFHSQIDSTALGVPGLASTTGVNAKLKLDYRPTSADSAQLVVTRSDKRLTPQGYVSAINIVNIGYRHQLSPDLTALVTASDVFNGQRTERFERTPSFTGDYLRTVRGRILYVGVVYTFGTAKKAKPANFEYDLST